MKPVILFRRDFHTLDTEAEFLVAEKYFKTLSQRSEIPHDSYVIGRYSVLPYYKELEKDLHNNCSCLANNFKQHNYIANFDYYYDIKDFTPKSWFDATEFTDQDGPFVVKGRTNSRRQQWLTHMYAETKSAAVQIGCELLHDSLIHDQGIVYRKYVELDKVDVSITGMPIGKEWRFFLYNDVILCSGFYWTTYEENIKTPPGAIELVEKVSRILSKMLTFYVVDVAQTKNGDFTVIEVNDAQMSGLSYCNPEELYTNLKDAISKESYV